MKRLLRVALCVLAAGFAAPSPYAAAKTAGSKNSPSQRVVLPTAVTPDHYRIVFTPDAKALTFAGSVSIDVTVHQATDHIVLNSTDIAIDEVRLSGESAAPVVSYDEQAGTATFAFRHKLKPAAYMLNIAYHGKIYQQSSGLFALDYDSAKGKERALFTQFENSDARRFVPCWDEPGHKATFELTATVPATQMPISNMPVAATDVLPGEMKRVHFARTPRMSSYLLFFAIGDFERVHREVDGVDIGVVVKRGDAASAAFALEAAAQLLPFYNNYFGVPYPLPKLDLVAGPGSSQFFSAMENWGAIFYFERALLVDLRLSTEVDKQDAYITIAHEMAHMWFGDLVTMAWWDDLWLNEGFASWMMYKAGDHFHPEWKVWLRAMASKQGAMNTDARDGTHPIVTPINDVMQASGAFDVITYSKGAAVIRTLESFLGEDAFRAGVRRYMHKYAFGNTVTDDFWKAMEESSRIPVTKMAHDLTLQAGVPLVSEVSLDCAGGDTVLGLRQSHFAIDADSTAAKIWRIPVLVSGTNGANAKIIVTGAKPKTVRVSGCGPVIINAGQTAYFRSRYSTPAFAAIAAHYAKLSSEDQYGIFNDTNSLAYVGMVPMSDFLELVKNFPADADPLVISLLVGRLQRLDRLYDGLPTQAAYRVFARNVLDPVFARVGWERIPGESRNVVALRADLIEALSQLGEPAILADGKLRYARYVADASSLDAESRHNALIVVAVHADQATWDQLHSMAKSAKTPVERQEFYALLGKPLDKGLAQQALDLSLSGEPPSTTAPQIINEVADRHPDMAFDFAVAHWDSIAPLIEFSTQASYMPYLITTATDLKFIAKLDSFAEGRIPANARQDVRKSEALLRYLVKVRNERLPEVDLWLKTQP